MLAGKWTTFTIPPLSLWTTTLLVQPNRKFCPSPRSAIKLVVVHVEFMVQSTLPVVVLSPFSIPPSVSSRYSTARSLIAIRVWNLASTPLGTCRSPEVPRTGCFAGAAVLSDSNNDTARATKTVDCVLNKLSLLIPQRKETFWRRKRTFNEGIFFGYGLC